MLLSYIPIANLALGHIGEDDRITDPDQDSRPARTIRRAWDTTFLFVLARSFPAFATRTVDLTARPADPDWPVALERTAFPLPGDFVSLAELVDPALDEAEDSYSIEAGPSGMELLVEDDGPITLRYIFDHPAIREPARWSPGFAETFAWRLAWQISDALAADKGRKDRADAEFRDAIKEARRKNNRMIGPKRQAAGPWERARRCGVERPPGT